MKKKERKKEHYIVSVLFICCVIETRQS